MKNQPILHPLGIPPLAELHAHIGASIPASILWSLAHQQGFRLPTKNYWEYAAAITAKPGSLHGVDDLTTQMYDTNHLVQSSPEALPTIMQHAVSGAYRHSNITYQEWRIDPLQRNRGGERDADHIILALLHGKDRAEIEYPMVRTGIIFEMYRKFSPKTNEVILQKAIKYKTRGIIGIDMCGPQMSSFSMNEHAPLFAQAREAGLGITVHTGEEGNVSEMEFVVDEIRPDRIGHGIQAYKHPRVMKKLVDQNIVLELCPTSNLNCSVIADMDEMKTAIRTLVDNGVRITLNTDGPDMHNTSLLKEFEVMREYQILSDEEIQKVQQEAFTASFLNDIPYRATY
jgi:adenosine deaminase